MDVSLVLEPLRFQDLTGPWPLSRIATQGPQEHPIEACGYPLVQQCPKEGRGIRGSQLQRPHHDFSPNRKLATVHQPRQGSFALLAMHPLNRLQPLGVQFGELLTGNIPNAGVEGVRKSSGLAALALRVTGFLLGAVDGPGQELNLYHRMLHDFLHVVGVIGKCWDTHHLSIHNCIPRHPQQYVRCRENIEGPNGRLETHAWNQPVQRCYLWRSRKSSAGRLATRFSCGQGCAQVYDHQVPFIFHHHIQPFQVVMHPLGIRWAFCQKLESHEHVLGHPIEGHDVVLVQLRLVHKLQPPLVQVIASGVFQDDVQGMLRRRVLQGGRDSIVQTFQDASGPIRIFALTLLDLLDVDTLLPAFIDQCLQILVFVVDF
mmetsp:Transcript_59058/g.129495  ORF Transcript_59058/g.129495 Transcript_59058/m.129495 type:complete len:373 (-) Transcript_59058:486-1604(-)